MTKNQRYVLIISIVIIAALTFGVITIISRRIPANSDLTTGNTAGNLYNEGLFFEMDGKVYFSNTTDSECLYVMNPDETDIKQITTMNVKYINGAGKYLYYYMDSSQISGEAGTGIGSVVKLYGLYRSKLNGSDQVCLDKDEVRTIQLYGNYLYYQVKEADRGTLKKIKINKTDMSVVNPDEMINPACNVDGVMYYNGTASELNLHTLNTLSGDTVATVMNGYFYNPIVKGTDVYYMDAGNNYKITKMNLLTYETTVLSEDRVDFYNMNDTYIYYSFSDADNPALKRMRLDGSDNTVIMQGITNCINLTSRYVYFKVYGVDNVYYHMPIEGGAVSTFTPIKK